jgi:circadian clock protein KaiC
METLERVPTRVPGLDLLVDGGLLRGGVYLVMGSPGVGKTVLSTQIAFRHAEAGGRALYVTLLAESHGRLLAHIGTLEFFDPRAVSSSVILLSGYTTLEEKQLDGLLDLLRGEVRRREATLLVIDGLTTAGATGETELALKKFVHELKAFVELVGCTCLLLTSARADPSHYPARTMVDGILELRFTRKGLVTAREIEIAKFRGSGHLMGAHLFDISNAGITVNPRIEAVYGSSPPSDVDRRRVEVGIAKLDAMLGGGLPAGSVTLVVGPTGSGKTSLALHFLDDGAARGERTLYLGFHEPAARFVEKAAAVGLPIGERVRDGSLQLEWIPPLGRYADQIVEELLATVRARGIERLVIDGLTGIAQSMFHTERLAVIFTALANELRSRGVTTLVTAESELRFGADRAHGTDELAVAVDNFVVLSFATRAGELTRFVAIHKMREGHHDTTARQFRITSRGFEVAPFGGRAERSKTPTGGPSRSARSRKGVRRRR